MTLAYLIAALILMLYLIIKWLYKRYQLGLFPFRRQTSVEAITPANTNPTGDALTADSNAVEHIASPNPNQPEANENEMAIFTIRRVPVSYTHLTLPTILRV